LPGWVDEAKNTRALVSLRESVIGAIFGQINQME